MHILCFCHDELADARILQAVEVNKTGEQHLEWRRAGRLWFRETRMATNAVMHDWENVHIVFDDDVDAGLFKLRFSELTERPVKEEHKIATQLLVAPAPGVGID